MLSDVSQLHFVKCLMQQTSIFKQVLSSCDFILMEMLSLSSFGYIELVFNRSYAFVRELEAELLGRFDPEVVQCSHAAQGRCLQCTGRLVQNVRGLVRLLVLAV